MAKPTKRPVPLSRTLPAAPKAEHSSNRSGYARDIIPGQLEPEERAGLSVPPASLSGRQAGVIPPAQRKFRPGTYKTVSLEEAQTLMAKRLKGEAPPIAGGLDQVSNINDPYPEAPEPDGDDGMTPVPPGQQPGQKSGHNVRKDGRIEAAAVPTVKAVQSPAEQYLAKRQRVTLELQDSTIGMQVVDAIVSRLSITLLLPSGRDGGTVVPKPGSELEIVIDERSYPAFFPGTQFDIPALGVLGLAFIRKEEA